MSEQLAPGRQGQAATIFGWVMFIGFFALFFNILELPRTALDQRGPLRVFHDSLGLIIAIMAVVRLVWMARSPAPQPPEGLPAASFAFNRALLVAFYLVFAVTGALGFLFAWGEYHRPVILFGIELPQLLPEGDTYRMPGGYFHSALGFYYMMLATIWLAFGFYQHLRYKAGIARLFPGPRL